MNGYGIWLFQIYGKTRTEQRIIEVMINDMAIKTSLFLEAQR